MFRMWCARIFPLAVSFKGVASDDSRSRSHRESHVRQSLRGVVFGQRGVGGAPHVLRGDWNRLRVANLPKTRSSMRGQRAQSV